MKNKEIKAGSEVKFNLDMASGSKEFIGTGIIVNENPDFLGRFIVKATSPVSYHNWNGRKIYKASVGTILTVSPREFI